MSTQQQALRWYYVGIALLVLILYGQTVTYQYALDDKLVITQNQFTKQGFSGIDDLLTTDSFTGFYGKQKQLVAGGRYRPLSLITFALEYQFWGKNPYLSHLINILLYLLTGILLLKVLQRCWSRSLEQPWYRCLPLVITLLFLAHPLHTEVVANIKGRDTILSFMGAIGALYYVLRYHEKAHWGYLGGAALCLFLGLLAKETAITFLAVIPLTLYVFKSIDWQRLLKWSFPLLGVTAIYLVIRFSVLGGPQFQSSGQLMNNPFINASTAETLATVFYTMGLYLKLLLFPHPLTHDYYPKQIPIIGWGDLRAIIPLLIYAALFLYALWKLRQKSVSAYAILFYFCTFSIVSNLVFPVGTFMNERFMYFPSLGFCLLLGYGITNKLPQWKAVSKQSHPVVMGVLILLLAGYSFKTIDRNRAWQSDYTLALTDVKTSNRSAKAHMSAGEALINRAKDQVQSPEKRQKLYQAIRHLDTSMRIHQTYFPPRPLLARAYYHLEQYQKSITWYEQALKMKSWHKESRQSLLHLGQRLSREGRYQLAAKSLNTLLPYANDSVRVYAELGKVYGKGLQQWPQAITYLKKARQLDPRDTNVLQKLGVVYAMQGQYQKALRQFEQALEVEPRNARILMNVGITYQRMGQPQKGQEYLDRAFEINPDLRKEM
jgi:tetratricopeptide (TPR) repeat protein